VSKPGQVRCAYSAWAQLNWASANVRSSAGRAEFGSAAAAGKCSSSQSDRSRAVFSPVERASSPATSVMKALIAVASSGCSSCTRRSSRSVQLAPL
jgi:hypothetical protein